MASHSASDFICEKYLRAVCPGLPCKHTHHFDIPYLWQVSFDGPDTWKSVPPEANVKIEYAFCMIQNDYVELELEHRLSALLQRHLHSRLNTWLHWIGQRQLQEETRNSDVWVFGASYIRDFTITCRKDGMHAAMVPFRGDFVKMEAQIFYNGVVEGPFAMRRLSTCSYGQVLLSKQSKSSEEECEGNGFCTQWRWYYKLGSSWKQFESTAEPVMQSVIEMKYLAGQEVYRFKVPIPDSNSPGASSSNPTSSTMVYLLNYIGGTVERANSGNPGNGTPIRRRPFFLSPENVQSKTYLPFPTWKPTTYLLTLPDQWFPIDFTQHYEMIPLNPDGLDFHLVASEFLRKQERFKINDIFRIQNPFLWQRFLSKKQYMEQHNIPLNELQLFHGTQSMEAVQAILRQNFDWRVSGKNATLYGKGSYFACNATLSHKYTGLAHDSTKVRWMFLARVLTGRSVKGNRDYLRPPPINPSVPDGDLYDSCVDKENHPEIHVIYDSDQCYPEYLINYQEQP